MANETIGSSGYDRTNVATWEAAQAANGTGTIMLAEDALGGSTVTIDAPYTLTLTADSSVAVTQPTTSHATSKARIGSGVGAGSYPILHGGGSTLTIERIGVQATRFIYTSQTSGGITLRRIVAYGDDDGSNGNAIVHEGSITITISNVALINHGRRILLNNGSGTINCYHVSILTGASAIAGFQNLGGTYNAYACVAQGAAACFDGTIGGDYNVSEDATAPGSSSTKYYRSTSGWFANTTPATADLALAAGAQGKWVTDGKDAIDQTGWPADVSTDIVGTARSAPIDPGVWQTPAAAAASTAKFLPLLGVG